MWDSVTDITIIYASAALALLWAFINALSIRSTKLTLPKNNDEEHLVNKMTQEKLDLIQEIGNNIAEGADSFLFKEYSIMSVFILIFGLVVLIVVDILGQEKMGFRCYATLSFVIGAFTSILCGYIGMRIAVITNYRTTYKAATCSLASAFEIAYKAGCVMGFTSVGLSLGILLSIMLVFVKLYEPVTKVGSENSYATLMELIAGYGLGGSSMALFGRVGGGIYTKAADVGADLVGKVVEDLKEDSPQNPATIADNVGDNVGDIAGMGSDLFGSFAESTCAALVVMANTPDLIKNPDTLYFPLLISSAGIIACFFTSIYGLHFYKVDQRDKIEYALKIQLFLSTVLVLVLLIVVGKYSLPSEWVQVGGQKAYWWYAVLAAGMGLISGFIIGMVTDYYTSNKHAPVIEMALACESGPAINVIYGLALGYMSTIVPIIMLALTALISIKLLGMFGVALSAIGMLSTLAVGLAIDVYGPISDNAGGISEMAELGEDVRADTDALDAAGNTTAAIGKGFAIGSAALVSLALYGAFITRAKATKENPIKNIEITDPWIFCSLLLGAMMPYAFSALTMKSVGSAAKKMIKEIESQFSDGLIKKGLKKPDYKKCIMISTEASLREMILPGVLVIFTPIFLGIVFHPLLVAGLLPGALLSGVQLAISMSNTGGAWDNTKKLIETGTFIGSQGQVINKKDGGKGKEAHTAAVIGDTIGDPLKDTSGPSLNILIKLMAIISLVFAGGFSKTSFLSGLLDIKQ
jgi:H(+)-translocating pyrophosphatase